MEILDIDTDTPLDKLKAFGTGFVLAIAVGMFSLLVSTYAFGSQFETYTPTKAVTVPSAPTPTARNLSRQTSRGINFLSVALAATAILLFILLGSIVLAHKLESLLYSFLGS